jgi:hypothetical protein
MPALPFWLPIAGSALADDFVICSSFNVRSFTAWQGASFKIDASSGL